MRCLRGGRRCEYTNLPTPTIEFVQHCGLEDSTLSTPPSESWRSVIEQQGAQDIPFWTPAESEGAARRASESREAQVHMAWRQVVDGYTNDAEAGNIR
jgi:hypothetical protein